MVRSPHNASGAGGLGTKAAAEQLSADPDRLFSSDHVIRDLGDRIASLETANHALRIEADESGFRFAEVEHRLMNSFGVIRGLVNATARPGDTGNAFRMSFLPRLMALANSHALLNSGHADDSTLDEVVRCCLSPHDDASGRVSVSGPEVRLRARYVPTLGLAFHELTTNATKYGALSVPAGKVDVGWTVQADQTGQGRMVEISWRECDGPPVRAPERRGFGSLLLERGLDMQCGVAVELDFVPAGFQCRIRMPYALG